MKVEFYDVKAKAKVKAEPVAKKQFANGRYAVLGKTADGRDLYRFVKKEDFDEYRGNRHVSGRKNIVDDDWDDEEVGEIDPTCPF